MACHVCSNNNLLNLCTRHRNLLLRPTHEDFEQSINTIPVSWSKLEPGIYQLQNIKRVSGSFNQLSFTGNVIFRDINGVQIKKKVWLPLSLRRAIRNLSRRNLFILYKGQEHTKTNGFYYIFNAINYSP